MHAVILMWLTISLVIAVLISIVIEILYIKNKLIQLSEVEINGQWIYTPNKQGNYKNPENTIKIYIVLLAKGRIKEIFVIQMNFKGLIRILENIEEGVI